MIKNFEQAEAKRNKPITQSGTDLVGDTLALTVDDTIIIDVSAAGHGWFVDNTPYQDSEFRPLGNGTEMVANTTSIAYGDMDLLTVVMHDLGHIFGYRDLDPLVNSTDLMSATLNEGIRRLPLGIASGQSMANSGSFIFLDLTPYQNETEDFLNVLLNRNPWLTKYLSRASQENPASTSNLPAPPPSDDQGIGTQPSPEPALPESNGKGRTK